MDTKRNLLILGEYATGKTTYISQLYERLKARKGLLRLNSAPKDLSKFGDALSRLSLGTSPLHTPSSEYNELVLPVSLPNHQVVEFVWPDYGGEQITSIINTRQINETWVKRLSESDGWLLFIRFQNLQHFESFLTKSVPVNTDSQTDEHDELLDQRWSNVAAFIELLQMFLYVKGVGTLERVTTPSLLILLSCWDEMDKEEQAQVPGELLQRRLPLLYEFVKTVWHPDRFSVWGLSSTGERLDEEQPHEAFQDYGPQKFGYVIHSDGTRRDDLTLPLFKLME